MGTLVRNEIFSINPCKHLHEMILSTIVSLYRSEIFKFFLKKERFHIAYFEVIQFIQLQNLLQNQLLQQSITI